MKRFYKKIGNLVVKDISPSHCPGFAYGIFKKGVLIGKYNEGKDLKRKAIDEARDLN